jgi:hypothetical protein
MSSIAATSDPKTGSGPVRLRRRTAQAIAWQKKVLDLELLPQEQEQSRRHLMLYEVGNACREP